jgi:HD superfamily phosphodiesterase
MLLTKLFNFILLTSIKHNIDESHGLSHSMNTLLFANKIFESEVIRKPQLMEQERIIYVSALLHDMCDKKYMNENEGIHDIEDFLQYKLQPIEIEATKNIISTMSYSTVKKNGFPDLKEYQTAYHIVRESDLLAAYDFDRAMLYHMHVNKSDAMTAFTNSRKIFMDRVLKHNDDELFITESGRRESVVLHDVAIRRMFQWRQMINKECLL